MSPLALAQPILALSLAPLFLGVVNRTKALVAGRTGQPLAQPYRDIWKLLQKGAVYSRTTTWIFRAGPVVGLATLLAATTLLPVGSAPAALSFEGDLILFATLLGLGRLFTILAALDTGSSFEGMGASREAQFGALAEPALLVSLAALARETGSLSLSPMLTTLSAAAWSRTGPELALVAAALLVVFLAENARIPVDDPTTHLELTMIHEVLVLAHGGPDLALDSYAAALKLWVLGSLIAAVVLPVRSGNVLLDAAAHLASLLALAAATGAIESSMARLRLLRVPQLLVGASVLSAVAIAMTLW